MWNEVKNVICLRHLFNYINSSRHFFMSGVFKPCAAYSKLPSSISTICPISNDLFYIVTYHIKMGQYFLDIQYHGVGGPYLYQLHLHGHVDGAEHADGVRLPQGNPSEQQYSDILYLFINEYLLTWHSICEKKISNFFWIYSKSKMSCIDCTLLTTMNAYASF